MSSSSKCPSCGTLLPVDAPEGLCRACLFKRGLESNTLGYDESRPAPGSRWTPPGVEEVAGRFPELEVMRLIGRGGMGAVYLARQKSLDRVVALKILPPEMAGDQAFADRFAREAQAMAKLNHPHIVTIHEFGQREGFYYFLMEYVDGVSLRGLLDAGHVSPKEALAIVPQICEALQYAHDQGIVHRDIKPENILLNQQGQVKIADFGLAKLIGLRTSTAEKVMGTPAYMAPEQKDRPEEVDHRADIYSLGVVFYQMLTGELPKGALEPPSRKVQIDVRLDEIVLKALERVPERRYQQASEIKTSVETLGVVPVSEAQAKGLAPYTGRGLPRWVSGLLWIVFALNLLNFAGLHRTHIGTSGFPTYEVGLTRPWLVVFPQYVEPARYVNALSVNVGSSSFLSGLIAGVCGAVIWYARRGGLPERYITRPTPRISAGILVVVVLLLMGLWGANSYFQDNSMRVVEAQNRVLEQMAKDAKQGPGGNGGPTGAAKRSFTAAELAQTPVLRFLAWQNEGPESETVAAWHPDGTVVGGDADEVRWLKEVRATRCDATVVTPDHRNPRFLHLWFSHPGFDQQSRYDVGLIDETGNAIPPGAAGMIGGHAEEAGDSNGELGWVAMTFCPGMVDGGRVPKTVAIRLSYSAGPWDEGKRFAPDEQGMVSLGNGSQFGGIGQNAGGRAFLAVAMDMKQDVGRQFGVKVVLKDGREVWPASTQVGGGVGEPVRVTRFEFDTQLAAVDHFQLLTRPIRSVTFADVHLLERDATTRPASTSQPVAAANEMVENPMYRDWAGFKPGDWVSQRNEIRPGGRVIVSYVTQKLLRVSHDALTLEIATTMDGRTRSRQEEVPAKTAKPQQVSGERGDAAHHGERRTLPDEDLTIAGKTYRCQVITYEHKSADAHLVHTSWSCPAVPGGIVKREMQLDREISKNGATVGDSFSDVTIVESFGVQSGAGWIGSGPASGPTTAALAKEQNAAVPQHGRAFRSIEVHDAAMDRKPGTVPNASPNSVTLTGAQVTDESLVGLEKRKDLWSLALISTNVTDDGLVHLEGLSNLRVLSLSGSKITGRGMVHVAKLAELANLNLVNTSVADDGLEHLQALSELDTLDVSGREITDVGAGHLKELVSLKSLGLIGTGITDQGLAQLEGLPRLERLWVAGSDITDAGVVRLAKLKQLQGLSLSDTRVTDGGLAELKALQHLNDLDLSGTAVTDAGLKHLEPLKHLKALNLAGTRVTEEGVERLRRALPGCRVSR